MFVFYIVVRNKIIILSFIFEGYILFNVVDGNIDCDEENLIVVLRDIFKLYFLI